MAVFTPIQKLDQPKVHYSQYIHTVNTTDDEGVACGIGYKAR